MKRWLPLLALVSGCQTGGPASPPPAPVRALKVEVGRPIKTDVDRLVELPGDAQPWRTARIHAKVSGQLKELRVDLGDTVRAGQVLAVLEVPELAREAEAARFQGQRAESEALAWQSQAAAEASQSRALEAEAVRSRWQTRAAQAQVDQMLAQCDLSQATWRRLQAIYDQDPGLMARQQLDEARAQALADRARLAAARRQWEASRSESRALTEKAGGALRRQEALAAQSRGALQLAQARYQERLKAEDWSDYTLLRAPFDGVVSRRNLDPGALVQSAAQSAQSQAMPVLEVVDDRVLRVTVGVPEMDAPFVKKGSRVEVKADALPDDRFSGRVSRVSGMVGRDRCMKIEVDLPNRAGRLKAGMFLRVGLVLETHAGVLAVPASAVLDEKGKLSVFVVKGDRVAKTALEGGFRNSRWCEVKGGLSGESTVVVKGKEQLVDGSPVEIQR